MVQALETGLAAAIEQRHVVCITNVFVALLMLLNTLPEGSEVAVTGEDADWMIRAFAWFPNLRAVRAKEDDLHSFLTPRTAAVLVGSDGSSLATKDACLHAGRADITVIADTTLSPMASHLGADAHVCRMYESDPINAVDGAYIATQNEALADTLRSMRSSSGVSRRLPVNKTVNGRMSEAHAALGLISLARHSRPQG
jgi:dTDP-4-amino-4,6-dideoxygalactose transaminase